MVKAFLRYFIPASVLGVYHYSLAELAAFWFKHPSRDLIVIGVTGTNGKSSTVQFIGRLLEFAGERVGWTTTASFKVAGKEWVNDKKMTMLGRFQTQKLLREMVAAGCRYAIVETSSQGIAQFRHVGIDYDVAVFTNLTPEHIESHGGFENYKAAKEKLFAGLSTSLRKTINGTKIGKAIVVNLDDQYAERFLSFEADRYGGCSLSGASTDEIKRLNTTPLQATNVRFESARTLFSWMKTDVRVKPIGRFNLENILLAAATVLILGFEREVLSRAIERLEPIPGRLEKIDEGQPFTVIVDYAYEPAALAAVYEAAALIPYKRLVHIVGSAGGGRDVARRQILGKMSAEHDDFVVVTNEDPYDEEPMRIINDVADAAAEAGKTDGVDLYRILDRQEAIDFAVQIAEPDDLVLITGKGSEPVMAVAGGKKVPWDDRRAARRALNKRYGGS